MFNHKIRRVLAAATVAAVTGGLAVAVLATSAPASANTHPTTIPDSALLQADDLGGHPTEPGDPEFRPNLKPPMPCGNAAHVRSERRLVAERDLFTMGHKQNAQNPDIVLENVALYRGSGATRYYGELQRGIRNCDGDGTTWTVVSRHGYGDRSMVVRLGEMSEGYDGQPYEHMTYLGVAQVGHVVVVVVNLGWEDSGGSAAVARKLLPLAVARAETL
jgi:hypothetical protein